jgi:hypothetical protein
VKPTGNACAGPKKTKELNMTRLNRKVIALAVGAGIALSVAGWTVAQDSRQPEPPVARIATADVVGIVERMLASDRYRPAQEAFVKQENDKLKPLADELAALDERGSKLAQGSPELQQLGREFDQKQEAFQKARQDAFGRIDAFNANHVREAYRLTLQEIEAISDRLGYTHVIASRTGEATIKSQNVAGALQEILARPVAKSAAADDLTSRLVRQLRLENVQLEDPPQTTPAPEPGTGRAPLPPTR